MELYIAGMYVIGIGVMICFMCNIKRFADRLFPLPEKEKATRQRGHAERMAEAINQGYCTREKEGCQVERKFAGVIKSGELVTIKGDPESIKGYADSAMAEEITRLRRENTILRGQLAMIRARDALHWQELSAENHQRPRHLPGWLKGLETRILTLWAVLTLGTEEVYGR